MCMTVDVPEAPDTAMDQGTGSPDEIAAEISRIVADMHKPSATIGCEGGDIAPTVGIIGSHTASVR